MPNLNPSTDYLRRLGIAGEIKTAMRRKYGEACRRTHGEVSAKFLSRSKAFWEEYEAVNRLWCPEDPVYSKCWSGFALSTTNSTWQLVAAAAGQVRVIELFISGEATTSAVNRVVVSRSVAGTGAVPTIYTPEKFNTRSPAATSTIYGALTANVAWGTTQETLNTNPLVILGFNAFGGNDRWVPQPGEELYLVNGEFMSQRSSSGTSITSGHMVFEEL